MLAFSSVRQPAEKVVDWDTVECDLISVIIRVCVWIPHSWLDTHPSLFSLKGPAALATVMDYLGVTLAGWVRSVFSLGLT